MTRSLSRLILRFAAVVAVAAVAACASPTQLEGEWKNPASSDYRIGSVLVVAAVIDSGTRRALEDGMVAALTSRGVKAQPSYRLLPDEGPSSEPDVGRAIASSGADSVLLMSGGRIATEVTIRPPTPTVAPVAVWGPAGFYGYYQGIWQPNYTPPSAFSVQSIGSDVRLIDARSKSLEWSGTLQTDMATAASKDALAGQYANTVVNALSKSGMLR